MDGVNTMISNTVRHLKHVGYGLLLLFATTHESVAQGKWQGIWDTEHGALTVLTGQTDAKDYPDAHGGRKRLPNTDDMFWLETSGGKRYARGYADLQDGDDYVRFGYD